MMMKALKRMMQRASWWGALLVCCGGLLPRALGQASLPIQPGQIVVTCFSGTSNNAVIPDPDNHVLAVIDTRDPLANGAVLGSNWVPPAGFFFHNEGSPDEWTAANLGEVFGVTLDDESVPNIYLTATTVYGNFPPGPGGYGAVYKLDGTTGGISSGSIPGQGDASLGSVCHNRSGNGGSWLYVSSLEDGRIYRVNADSLVVHPSSYDHGIAGRAAAAMAPIPDPSSLNTLSPLGRRVWGVQVHEGRLYYGVWWEDATHASAVDRNEVWSVALNPATGAFLPATAMLEVSLPPASTVVNWSLPVASIDFSRSGAMLLAERYYRWDGVHRARVLEYTGGSGAWVASPLNKYRIGDSSRLSAGGVASDCDENVWATGDILHGNIYGVQRVPAGGNAADAPATANSLLIDIDTDIVHQDKTLLGAVDILNDCDCLVVDELEVSCPKEGGAPFELSFNLTNQSGQTVNWVLLTPVSGLSGIEPAQIPLTAGLADGDSILLEGIELLGGNSGEEACFTVTLLTLRNGQLEECCTDKVRIQLPECECVSLVTESVECLANSLDGSALVEVCVNVTNLGTTPLHHVFGLADPALGLSLEPNYVALTPPLAPGESRTLCFRVRGAAVGHEVKIPLTFHDRSLSECCVRQLCFEVPDKPDPNFEFCCRLTERVYCCPQTGRAKALLVVCNKSNQPREYEWQVQPMPATPDCPVMLDPATDFAPSNGSLLVPPGECREVVVEIDCEGLNESDPACAHYGITVSDPASGRREFCRGRVVWTQDPTVKQVGANGSDDPVPMIVNAGVDGNTGVRFEVSNGSDEAVDLELLATGENGLLRFRVPGNRQASEWRMRVRLAAGASRTVRVDFSVDGTAAERLAQVQALGVSLLNLYWQFPNRASQLAASVPLVLVGAETDSRVVQLRRLVGDTGDPEIELVCEIPPGERVQLEMCEALGSGEWSPAPFKMAGSETPSVQVLEGSPERLRLRVPLATSQCFFRLKPAGAGHAIE